MYKKISLRKNLYYSILFFVLCTSLLLCERIIAATQDVEIEPFNYGDTISVSSKKGSFDITIDQVKAENYSDSKRIKILCVISNYSYDTWTFDTGKALDLPCLSSTDADDFLIKVEDEDGFILEAYSFTDGMYKSNDIPINTKARACLAFEAHKECKRIKITVTDKYSMTIEFDGSGNGVVVDAPKKKSDASTESTKIKVMDLTLQEQDAIAKELGNAFIRLADPLQKFYDAWSDAGLKLGEIYGPDAKFTLRDKQEFLDLEAAVYAWCDQCDQYEFPLYGDSKVERFFVCLGELNIFARRLFDSFGDEIKVIDFFTASDELIKRGQVMIDISHEGEENQEETDEKNSEESDDPKSLDWDTLLKEMSYNDLIDLKDKINLAMWHSDDWIEIVVPQGLWKVGDEIPAGHWTVKSASSYDIGYTKISWGEKLNDSQNEIDNGDTVTIHNINNKNGITEYSIEVKDGDYIIVDKSGSAALFTPYSGKPSFDFK